MSNTFSKVFVLGAIGAIAVGAYTVITDDELRAKLKEQILSLMDATGRVITAAKRVSEEFASKDEGPIGTIHDIAEQWETVEAKVIH